MAESYSTDGRKGLADPESCAPRAVLVTGAKGNIGLYFAEHCCRQYRLRLMVRDAKADSAAPLAQWGEVVSGELDDLDRLKELCSGIDTVVHLAARASAGTAWKELLESNVVGAYNVFVAAKAAGCRRVVFASSIHAVSGYPSDVQVKVSEPVNPGDLYGVSKCFGEALARYMAEQEGLSCIALRIGAFQPEDAAQADDSVWMIDSYVSRRDLNQLLERSIDAPDSLRFAVFAGLSDNRFKRMDISNARELVGYAPEDDLTEINRRLRPLRLDDVPGHNLSDRELPSGLREDL